MKVLLRNRETGQYYQNPEQWTADRREAVVFDGSARALLFARELRSVKLELVLVFDDPSQDLRLPLPLRRQSDPGTAVGV